MHGFSGMTHCPGSNFVTLPEPRPREVIGAVGRAVLGDSSGIRRTTMTSKRSAEVPATSGGFGGTQAPRSVIDTTGPDTIGSWRNNDEMPDKRASRPTRAGRARRNEHAEFDVRCFEPACGSGDDSPYDHERIAGSRGSGVGTRTWPGGCPAGDRSGGHLPTTGRGLRAGTRPGVLPWGMPRQSLPVPAWPAALQGPLHSQGAMLW